MIVSPKWLTIGWASASRASRANSAAVVQSAFGLLPDSLQHSREKRIAVNDAENVIFAVACQQVRPSNGLRGCDVWGSLGFFKAFLRRAEGWREDDQACEGCESLKKGQRWSRESGQE